MRLPSKTFLIAATLAGFFVLYHPQISAQEIAPEPKKNPSAELPGLISEVPLNSPLRSQIHQLRFSPNGNYILVQDASTVYVLTHEPLAFQFSLPARAAWPARFSADSNSLVIVSIDGMAGTWSLPAGQPLGQKKLDLKEGCISGLLSPDAQFFACEGPRFDLHLFRAASGEELFSDSLKAKMKAMVWYPISRLRGSAFPEPVGYAWSKTLQPSVDPTNSAHRMDFSPDGKLFALADPHRDSVLVVDLSTNTKRNSRASLQRKLGSGVHFITSGKIVAADPGDKQSVSLLEFPSGRPIEKLPIKGVFIAPATTSRHLIFREDVPGGLAAFGLDSKSILKFPPQAALDIHGDEIAGVSSDGLVSIFRTGERVPHASTPLPRAPLGILQVAAVSPDLRTLFLSSEGRAAVWDIASGNLLDSYSGLAGAWCDASASCYLHFLEQGSVPARVEKMDLTKSAVLPSTPSAAPSPDNVSSQSPATTSTAPDTTQRLRQAWPVPASASGQQPPDQYVSSGPVLLHITRYPSSALPYNSILQALDIMSGKLLWSRMLESGLPIPFVNPQGDRMVFAWRAETPGARGAAARNPSAREALQKAKLQAQDTFFEIVDARSGKMLGGTVVQSSAGPERFDCAFSAGDWLVTSRDANRLVIQSISTGEEKGRTFGYFPAIAPENGLLAVADGASTLTLYTLSKFEKRSTYHFPNPVAYARFTGDGKRLFVLTAHQVAYILDVSGKSEAAASTTEPATKN